jgi:hypothetical protein
MVFQTKASPTTSSSLPAASGLMDNVLDSHIRSDCHLDGQTD